MTQEQIESAEDHYDDYRRYAQECFGVSWTPGNPCDVCDDKKECSEKYLLAHPNTEIAQINSCEYEKRWETICREQSTTDPMVSKKYESYSCMLCFCRYPERECRVKRVRNMQNDRVEIANAILDEFAQWCSSRYVDQQLRDFKVYKSLNKVGEE